MNIFFWVKKYNQVKLICFIGPRFLDLHFITAKTREKAFIFLHAALTAVVLFSGFTMFVTRNESYSLYQLIRIPKEHKISYLVSLLLYIGVTNTMMLELLLHGYLILSTTYISTFSMKYWLHKIWLVMMDFNLSMPFAFA